MTVALVVFLFVIKPANALMARMRREPPGPYCLNTIPSEATRCGFCTSDVAVLV